MLKALNLLGGVVGLAAAVMWFLAARVQPAPGAGAGAFNDIVPSPDMPFYRRWALATSLNLWAAGLTGLSVLLSSAAQIMAS